MPPTVSGSAGCRAIPVRKEVELGASLERAWSELGGSYHQLFFPLVVKFWISDPGSSSSQRDPSTNRDVRFHTFARYIPVLPSLLCTQTPPPHHIPRRAPSHPSAEESRCRPRTRLPRSPGQPVSGRSHWPMGRTQCSSAFSARQPRAGFAPPRPPHPRAVSFRPWHQPWPRPWAGGEVGTRRLMPSSDPPPPANGSGWARGHRTNWSRANSWCFGSWRACSGVRCLVASRRPSYISGRRPVDGS